MKISFIDLSSQYHKLKREIDSAILQVVSSGQYVLGTHVRGLENEFVRYHRTKYAVGLASGTDAILLSLRACGIGPGDEVIVPAFTFISTASMVCYAGAKPVFADINPVTFTLTADTIESALTKKTKAVIVVHLYGQMVDMNPILQLCKRKNLILIEDVAQATGAEYHGKKAGTFGKTACFSFYPTKTLGGAGDGGMVITSNSKIEKNLRQLRDHGQSSKYRFDQLGYNSRLDEIQATVLRIKFHHLDQWINKRRNLAKLYIANLKNISEIICPIEMSGTQHAYHLFTIRAKKRDKLREFLQKEGIGTGVHYPSPLHTQKAFSLLGYKSSDFPYSQFAAKEVLSLPMYPEMPESHIDIVSKKIRKFYRK